MDVNIRANRPAQRQYSDSRTEYKVPVTKKWWLRSIH